MFLIKRKSRRNRRVWRESYLLEVKVPLRARLARQKEWALRLLPLAGAALVCLALGLGGVQVLRRKLLLENPDFAIRTVAVSSDGIIPPGELALWSAVRVGDNLASVDPVKVKARLESVPMIRAAEVRKSFPDKLTIRVNERIAAAQIVPSGTASVFFVDAEGVVFSALRGSSGVIAPSAARRLVTVTGVAAERVTPGRRVQSVEVMQALALIRAAERTGLLSLLDLRLVDVTQPGVLRLVSARGGLIWVEPQELESQLQRLHIIAWRAKSERREIRTADLRGVRTAAVTYF
jgi:hypothetical protein